MERSTQHRGFPSNAESYADEEKQEETSSPGRREGDNIAATSNQDESAASQSIPGFPGLQQLQQQQQQYNMMPYVDFGSTSAMANQIGQLAVAYSQLPLINQAFAGGSSRGVATGTALGSSSNHHLFEPSSNFSLSTAGLAHMLSQFANLPQAPMNASVAQSLQHTAAVATMGGSQQQQRMNSLANFPNNEYLSQAIGNNGLLTSSTSRTNPSVARIESSQPSHNPPVAWGTEPHYSAKVLALDQDTYELSPYQCLVRKQLEAFEQPPNNIDVEETTQGRNRPVVPGQVGIRCRHCAAVRSSPRTRGAVLFPSTLLGVYQSAQNMANTHLIKICKMIPEETRAELIRVRIREQGKKTCKSAYGGGRQYWATSLLVLGVVETADKRLCFSTSQVLQPAAITESPAANVPGSGGSAASLVHTGPEQEESTLNKKPGSSPSS
jgi:hypothetical protein